MKLSGKQSCDLVFILAFLKAREEANRLGKTIPIEGYNYYVSPVKDFQE